MCLLHVSFVLHLIQLHHVVTADSSTSHVLCTSLDSCGVNDSRESSESWASSDSGESCDVSEVPESCASHDSHEVDTLLWYYRFPIVLLIIKIM